MSTCTGLTVDIFAIDHYVLPFLLFSIYHWLLVPPLPPPSNQEIIHMMGIVSKPSDLMRESYAWCFKDAEKIDFWKCSIFSQDPPTPCMWWNYLNPAYNSLWCVTTTRKEKLQHYSDAKTAKTKRMHNIFFHDGKIGVTGERDRHAVHKRS